MRQPDFEYLIVGQGIAGTIFSYILEREGKSYMVMDPGHDESASAAAAGIINPITSKKFVLSWMYDQLYPSALQIYNELLLFLSIEVSISTLIIRGLKDEYQTNEWNYRAGQEKYRDYLGELPDMTGVTSLLKPFAGFAAVNKALQVPISTIVMEWRKYLEANGRLMARSMDYSRLKLTQPSFGFEDYRFQKIVLCEGSGLVHNPLFNSISLEPAKGEVLLMDLPDWHFPYIFKDELFIAPWTDHGWYWVGSTYEWDNMDPSPTPAKRQFILDKFSKFYRGKFTVEGHLAGIRPSTRDRRPIVGAHSSIRGVYILNGMGTKGTSLTPFFAQQLYNHIESGASILFAVDPGRLNR